jgi:AAA family ATP:ADP antiporter
MTRLPTADHASGRPHTRFDHRVLRLFANVCPGESTTALLLALKVFLILTAYYVLKPVREALILGEGTAEEKAYLSAGQVFLLAFVVPLYARLVARLDRRRLINGVNAFFVACLVVFYLLGHAGAPLGIPFFLWIGIFNMMIVAQFWSFANDVYSKDEGERLFSIVGFAGAVFGSGLAGRFIHRVGVLESLLVGGALLIVQVLTTNYLDTRERQRTSQAAQATAAKAGHTASTGVFAMVFKNRYILLIGIMLLMHNWVKTTGEPR